MLDRGALLETDKADRVEVNLLTPRRFYRSHWCHLYHRS